MLKTEFEVPPAAQISRYFIKSLSIKVRIFSLCPKGGTPPIEKPVLFLTNSASAFLIPSPISCSILFSSILLKPLAITRIGFPVFPL